MSYLADSQMSCYIHIHISAARLVQISQNIKHEIDFSAVENVFAGSDCTLNNILWQIDLIFWSFQMSFMCDVWLRFDKWCKNKNKDSLSLFKQCCLYSNSAVSIQTVLQTEYNFQLLEGWHNITFRKIIMDTWHCYCNIGNNKTIKWLELQQLDD